LVRAPDPLTVGPSIADLRDLRAEIASLSDLLRNSMASSRDNTVDVLRRELQEMSGMIQQAKREIAAMKPQGSPNDNRILSATEELDAIVSATERATGEILTKAERLGEVCDLVGALPGGQGLQEELSTISMDLLLACSFQDITGQRITKVVNVLRYLETRINSMVEIWGRDAFANTVPASAQSTEERADAHLLNGPQLDGAAISQNDVDRMFSS
jgi:chemotaxis protein CheZ